MREMRKRIFARVYGSDISFSVFLGRPPRVSKRFSQVHVPLDVEEDGYNHSGPELEAMLAELDASGWNIQNEIRRSSSLRWIIPMTTIREDILELLLGRDVQDARQKIA